MEGIPEKRLKKQRGVKRRLLQFGQPVLVSILASAMYDNLITPAIPFLPKVPFILYSIFMTAFAVLFLLGLVAAIWRVFATGWQHLTRRELRNDLRENIQRWPASKWDLLPVLGTTYVVATMLPMVTILLVLPQGRLIGVVSQEELAKIFLVVFIPIMLIFAAMMIRWGFEAYPDMRQRWVSGTRKERYTYAAVVAFVLVVWVFMVAGGLAGWDDMLWMNNT